MNPLFEISHFLRPIYKKDMSHWENANQELPNQSFFWNAGAGFDFSPIIQSKSNGIIPATNLLYLMSDYDIRKIDLIQQIYANIKDKCNFDLTENTCYSNICPEGLKISITQLIPLQIFSEEKKIELEQQRPHHFHSFMTTSVIPHQQWHASYMKVYVFDIFGICIDILPTIYFHIENLLLYEEIICHLQSNWLVFCATRVAGKSGSWDQTHSFEGAILPTMVKKYDETGSFPLFWMGTETQELESKGFLYHSYVPNWDKRNLVIYRTDIDTIQKFSL